MSTRIFYPYEVDRDGSIQTIHRELATKLREAYAFTGFVRNDLKRVNEIFDRCILIDDLPKPIKGFQFSKEYFKNYDIVHTGQPRHFKRDYRLAKVASLRGAKIVHTLHTPWYEEPEKREYQRKAVRHADIVTAVYPYIVEWAQNTFKRDDIHLIPNGVDINQFTPATSPTDFDKLLFVGWFKEEKHPEVVVEIARKLPEMEVVMVGRGVLLSDIREKIPDNVTIYEHRSKSELAELYASSLALLCPFDVHGAGMVALEAASCGTPVVGIETGASPLTVTDQSGVLLNSIDSDRWVTAIRDVRQRYEEFSPRDAVKKFSWDKIAAEYARVYDELLD